MRLHLAVVAICLLSAICSAMQPGRALASATLRFAGYDWEVRSGAGDPGPNSWSNSNAWVDDSGYLHLRISQVDGVWYCAEINTTERLGFGTYQFDVQGAIDTLDKNIVFGLFNYPTDDVGPDGTNEIDIEFSRWGDGSYPNGNYTVWPAQAGVAQADYTFDFADTASATTHRFSWSPGAIAFRSAEAGGSGRVFGSWDYAPSDPATHIPQSALPLHMNLWLVDGAAPSDGMTVELVITGFSFTPLSQVFLPGVQG